MVRCSNRALAAGLEASNSGIQEKFAVDIDGAEIS